MRELKTVLEWIRIYSERFDNPRQYTIEQVRAHVEERLARGFYRLYTKCAIGLLQYESNRGRSPNYLAWLEQSLEAYKRTKNIDMILDVAFYAIAESEDPSIPGTFYDSNDSSKAHGEV